MVYFTDNTSGNYSSQVELISCTEIAISLPLTVSDFFEQLFSKPYSNDSSTGFECFVYDGILCSAFNNDRKSLFFNLKKLQEKSPENFLFIIDAARKIANYLGHHELVFLLGQEIAQKSHEGFIFNSTIVPVHEKSSLSNYLLSIALVIGGIFLGIELYSYFRALKPEISQDLCQNQTYKDICAGHLSIKRIDMPQVEGLAKENFLNTYSPELIQNRVIPAKNLLPVQGEMNINTVMGIIDAFNEGTFNPCSDSILTTFGDLDNFQKPIFRVIDGHHRYAACRILGGNQAIISIKDTASNVLNRLKTFPGIYHLNLSE